MGAGSELLLQFVSRLPRSRVEPIAVILFICLVTNEKGPSDEGPISCANKIRGLEQHQLDISLKTLQWPQSGFGLKKPAKGYMGIRTVSMTWMTPFFAWMSALTNLALLMVTPWELSMARSWPLTVVALLSRTTSLASTLPATT